MLLAVRSLLFVVCCLLFDVCRAVLIVRCFLSVVY